MAQLKHAKDELKKAKSLLQMTELKCRKRVLRRLGYCTAADVIELKGRVACELSSGDELLLTEMIFNGIFNALDVTQTAALLSCFVCDEKSNEMPKLSEALSGPLKQMQDLARRIAKVSVEAKLELEEDEYVEKFKPYMMDLVAAWCRGASFGEICKMTDLFEGNLLNVKSGKRFALISEKKNNLCRKHYPLHETVRRITSSDGTGIEKYREHRIGE